MDVNITESKAKPNKAFSLKLTASGPSDMEFLTALAAAFIHKRLVTVSTTDDPDGNCIEFTPGEDDPQCEG